MLDLNRKMLGWAFFGGKEWANITTASPAHPDDGKRKGNWPSTVGLGVQCEGLLPFRGDARNLR